MKKAFTLLIFSLLLCCCEESKKNQYIRESLDTFFGLNDCASRIDSIDFSSYKCWEVHTGLRYWQIPDSTIYYSVSLIRFNNGHSIGFLSYEGEFSYHEDIDTSLLSDTLSMDTLSVKMEIMDLYSRLQKICIDKGFVILHYLVVPELHTQHSQPQFFMVLYDRKHQTVFYLYKYDKEKIEYNQIKCMMLNDEKNHLLTEGWFINFSEVDDD